MSRGGRFLLEESILLCLEDVVDDANDALSKGLIAVRLQA